MGEGENFESYWGSSVNPSEVGKDYDQSVGESPSSSEKVPQAPLLESFSNP